MSANFDFLQGKTEYQLFAPAAIEAERVLVTSPAMAAVGARKALELAVKWVYSADNTISMPYKNNLQALIHEPTFRFALDHRTWGKLPYIIKLLLFPAKESQRRIFQGRPGKADEPQAATQELTTIDIQDRITDRYYQKEAIRAVCGNIDSGHRKSLLVMATGTGKTRTASSLTDVLSRGGYITNTLFLADRTALVKQAKDDFKTYLPDMSLCNLLNGREDKNARIVFSTYPTMLNSIDTAKSENGSKLFTPAHFDLIIVDEAHRSIFKNTEPYSSILTPMW